MEKENFILVNGNREAVALMTDAAVHSLFKWKLPGIFHEMDSFCICCHQAFFSFFSFSWSESFKAKLINSIASFSCKVIYLTECLLNKADRFILALAQLMEWCWWYVRRGVKCACEPACLFSTLSMACIYHTDSISSKQCWKRNKAYTKKINAVSLSCFGFVMLYIIVLLLTVSYNKQSYLCLVIIRLYLSKLHVDQFSFIVVFSHLKY